MRVQVKLFATLCRYANDIKSGTPFVVDLPDNTTLVELCRRLALPAGEVKITFVNGRVRPDDWILQTNDEVGIFPPVGGG